MNHGQVISKKSNKKRSFGKTYTYLLPYWNSVIDLVNITDTSGSQNMKPHQDPFINYQDIESQISFQYYFLSPNWRRLPPDVPQVRILNPRTIWSQISRVSGIIVYRRQDVISSLDHVKLASERQTQFKFTHKWLGITPLANDPTDRADPTQGLRCLLSRLKLVRQK